MMADDFSAHHQGAAYRRWQRALKHTGNSIWRWPGEMMLIANGRPMLRAVASKYGIVSTINTVCAR